MLFGILFSLIEKEDKFTYPFGNKDGQDEEEYSDIINSEINDKKPKEIELEDTSENK